MQKPSTDKIALLGIFVLTAIWSLNWVVMKLALRDGGPFAFSALRYLLGTAGLFALLALLRRPLRPTPWLPTLGVGLTQTAGFQLLVQLSLVSGGAGKMAILAYSMPFWIVPLAWWWLGERPGRVRWLCIAAAAVGFVLVVQPWQAMGEAHSVALALASGLTWAVSAVLAKRMFQRYPDVTPLRLTAWQMLYGTVALVVAAVLVPERSIHWTASYVGALLYAGILASSIAWVAWAVVVQRVAASVAGLTSLAVPVCSVLFAWALLGESPSSIEWLGIALIAAALAALNFAGSRPGR